LTNQSATQEIRRIFMEEKAHYRVYNSPERYFSLCLARYPKGNSRTTILLLQDLL